MRHRPNRLASLSNTGLALKSLLVATLLAGALPARGETTTTSPGEQTRPRPETVFQVAARADYVGTEGRLRRRDAIVGSTQLRFSSPARPIVAGLLIEYRLVDEQADMLLVAGMFTYRTPKWTASASPFYEKTEHRDAGRWDYWTGVRRHVASRHALGVELSGSIDTGRAEKLMLGYYGTITETLRVSVAAGPGWAAGPDWVATASVTWRPRSRRR
jgi:hypothetical protein